MPLNPSGRSLEERLAEHKKATHQLYEEIVALAKQSLDGSDVSEKVGLLQLQEIALHETGDALRKEMGDFFNLANLSLKTAQAVELDRILPAAPSEETLASRKPRM